MNTQQMIDKLESDLTQARASIKELDLKHEEASSLCVKHAFRIAELEAEKQTLIDEQDKALRLLGVVQDKQVATLEALREVVDAHHIQGTVSGSRYRHHAALDKACAVLEGME